MPSRIMNFGGAAVALTFCLAAAGGRAQQTTAAAGVSAPPTATDQAYINGYAAGYADGQQDVQNQAGENAHKFRIYQEADSGYSESYGPAAAYRSGFQSGFDDGYADGYHNRPPTLGGAGVAAAPPDPIEVAHGNGYRDGYNAGAADAAKGVPNSALTNPVYLKSDAGYDAKLGPADQYQLNFRSGFMQGYEDGFNHRVFDRAVGLRGGAMPVAPGLVVPDETILHAVLNKTISTKTSHPGDAFTATITVPVWVGAVAAIPAGSTIQGVVKEATPGGKASGSAQIQLEYDTVVVPGQPPTPLSATTAAIGDDKVNPGEGTVNGPTANTGQRAGTDAALGGIMGGIFGGMGGLIRGGIAGAAVGSAGAIISHKKDLELREGQAMQIRLQHPLELAANGPRADNGGQ